MNKEEYYKYLQSKEWSQIKLDLIQTRGAKCERCGATRKHLRYLHIHHLTYKNIGNENPEDLEILCAPCHRNEHCIVKKRKPRGLSTKQKNQRIIESIKSKKGGFSKKSLARLGVKWPPKKGWRKNLEDGPLIKLKPINQRPNRKPKNKKQKLRGIDKRWKAMRDKFGFGNI